MVNTGKPSQGCGTCRARRIKCDEAKPTCLRCVKANRHCSGYRRPEELHGLLGRKRKGSRPQEVQSNSGDLVRTLFIGPSARLPSIPSYLLQMSQSPLGGSISHDSALSTPIIEQAVNYFINKFVLSPSRGNSRSYMEFVIPAVDNILSLSASNSPLGSAVLAVSLASLATRPNSRSLLPMASTQYSKALHQMNRVLQDPELALKDQTLATVIILTLYEVLTGSAAQPGGWCSHTDGAIILVKVREKCEMLNPEGRILHVMARGQMTVNCIISSRRPKLGVSWWMRFGSKDGLPAVCAKMNLETAELHADINHCITNAEHNPADHEKITELLYLAQDLEGRYKSWENDLPPTWRYHTLAWMNSVDDEKLQDSHTFPGRVDEYTDINIAAAWNMMRAARIMLNADIIRCRAWVSPSNQDYRISPEYMTAARTSRTLIDDMISSAPAFLGFTQGTQDDGGLNGKSALALFILWPLFMVTISDFVSDSQRKWALGRLRYMSDVMGIKQAALYSMFEIRLPSMFIYRDKMAEVYGKQEAIKRTMELAKITSRGLEIETEIVVAGILGCTA